MTTGFVRHRRSKRAIATLSAFEADLLRTLAGQLAELLHNESAIVATEVDPLEALLDFSGPTTEPTDPVLARLLPTAYRDDDEAAGEFRRYTEGALRDSKARGAACIIDTLEEAGLPDDPGDPEQSGGLEIMIDVELDAETALIWLRSLTDLRLALGTRLGVEDGQEEMWDSLADDDPRLPAYQVYEWLGFLQETLVRSIDR